MVRLAEFKNYTKVAVFVDDCVEFKLTDFGASIMNSNRQKAVDSSKHDVIPVKEHTYKKGDEVFMSVWEMLRDFGGENVWLYRESFCEDGIINMLAWKDI
jgi:hypothetical protein